jgi:acylphosphatase
VGIKRYHLLVSGLVQGVGYRYFVQQIAEAIDIKGWTRNLADGRVEILVEGDESALNHFYAQCKKGSRLSDVSDLTLSELEPEYNFYDFTIRPTV